MIAGLTPLAFEYSTIIAAFLTGIAGPLILAWVRHGLNRKKIELEKRKKEFEHAIETQGIVNKALDSLLVKYDLDRIWLAQFHNGGNYYPGNKSMKKMSVSFESVAPGVSSDIMKMQNLPVSFFSTILQRLNSGQESFVVDVTTEEDYALRSFWENRGVTSVYLFPIICIGGVFIGVLGVDFVKRDGFLNEQTFNHFKREANLLSGYVSLLSTDLDK
jgi:hypothetical protein